MRALRAIGGILERDEDADDVLRDVVAALVQEPTIAWAGISFREQGELVPGPSSGRPDERRRTVVDVSYQGEPVGALAVDGEADRAFLEQIAELVSAHVLLGWDTGGESWEP